MTRVHIFCNLGRVPVGDPENHAPNCRVCSKNLRGEYIGIGIFHLLLGLVYMDGAFAFLGDEGMLHVSILMFGSTASDLVASSMMIILFFLKPQESNPTPTQKKEELL